MKTDSFQRASQELRTVMRQTVCSLDATCGDCYVLIVEESDLVAEMLSLFIKLRRAESKQVNTVQSALTLLEAELNNIVCIIIEPFIQNGNSFINILKNQYREVPYIIYSTMDLAITNKQYPNTVVLQKGGDAELLLSALPLGA